MNCTANRKIFLDEYSRKAKVEWINKELEWVRNCLKDMPYLSEVTKQRLVEYARNLKEQLQVNHQQEEQTYVHDVEKHMLNVEVHRQKLNQLQTEQQKMVYDLRFQGLTAQRIADTMHYSVRTIRRINKQIAMILGSGC